MNVYKYLKQLIVAFLFIMPILKAFPFACFTTPSAVVIYDIATSTVTGTCSTPGANLYDIAVLPSNQDVIATGYTTNTVYACSIYSFFVFPITAGIGLNPAGIAVSPTVQNFVGSSFIVVANAGDQSFSIAPGVSFTQYTLAYTGIKRPNFVAIAPDSQTAYITDAGDGTSSPIAVYPIDVSNPNAPVPLAPIPVPAPAASLMGIAITSDSQTAYVVSINNNTVYVINNLKTNPTTSPNGINLDQGPVLGISPYGIALSNDNTTAYVSNSDPFGPSISVISGLPTNPTPTTYALAEDGSPRGLAITPDNNFVYIANYLPPASPVFSFNIMNTQHTTFNIDFLSSTNVAMSLIAEPPSSIQGCSVEMGSTLANIITWTPPASGILISYYNIYRGTVSPSNLIAQVSSFPLEYIDTNPPPQAQYTYNVTSVSTSSIPDLESLPISITLTAGHCSILPPSSITGCASPMPNDWANTISWTPPTSGVTPTAYQIYRDGTLINTVPSNQLSYQDSFLTPYMPYTYAVYSLFANVPSAHAATITIYPYDLCHPDIFPPSSITGCASPMLNDWVNTISWTPPTSGLSPTAYEIYRDDTLISTVPSTQLSYEDSYLTPNIPYTYSVYSVNAGIPSYQAATITIYPYDLCHPAISPPSSITGCAMQEGNTVTNIITWTPPYQGPMPTEYQIFRDPSLYDLVATVPSYQLSYEDTNLNPSMTYSYYIISVDQYGDVSNSIGITITESCSYPTPPTPSDPTNAIGTIRSNNFLNKTECVLTMTWTPSTSANVASYNIYNGTTLVANIPSTAPSTFKTLLSKGNNGQNYSITAVNSNGLESDHVPVIIQCPPRKCKRVKKC